MAVTRERACRQAAHPPGQGAPPRLRRVVRQAPPFVGMPALALGTLHESLAPTGHSHPLLSFDSRGAPTLETFNRRTASGGCSGDAEWRAATDCKGRAVYSNDRRGLQKSGELCARPVVIGGGAAAGGRMFGGEGRKKWDKERGRCFSSFMFSAAWGKVVRRR